MSISDYRTMCFKVGFVVFLLTGSLSSFGQEEHSGKVDEQKGGDRLITIAHQYLDGLMKTPYLRKEKAMPYISDLHAHSMLYPYLNSRLGIIDPADESITSRALPKLERQTLSWNMLDNAPLDKKALKKMNSGERTSFKLYPQSDLPNMAEGNVRSVVMCFHPLEKGFTKNKMHRFINHHFFSGVDYEKLRHVGGAKHSSFSELMGEYYLAINHARQHDGLSIQFPKVYNNNAGADRMNIYLAFEGAHALFDEKLNNLLLNYDQSLASARNQMLRFKNVSPKMRDTLKLRLHEINSQAEGIANRIHELKTLPEGRFVYATTTHLLNNGLMGQAKGFDSGKGLQRIALDLVFNNHDVLKALKLEEQIIETQPGIRDLGYSTIFELLDTKEYGIAIDIKHMDPFSRRDYFDLLSKNIAFKGAWTEGRLMEVMEDPEFYDQYFEVYQSYELNAYQPVISSHSGLSRLDFDQTLKASLRSTDLNKWRANKITGWTGDTEYPLLYAMPINLSNEEVLLIYASRGLVGLMLDERLVGGSLMRYKKRVFAKPKVEKDYIEAVGSDLEKDVLKDRIERYTTLEPLLRNVFNTVAIVYEQCENDRLFALEALRRYYPQAHQQVRNKDNFRFANFKRVLRMAPGFQPVIDSMKRAFVLYAWDHICLGSDYDGIIDPIDAYSTASALPQLWSDCLDFLNDFIAVDPDHLRVERLLIDDRDLLFQKFFQLNLENYLSNNLR